MAKLPQEVKDAWSNREGWFVLSTVSADGEPNAAWMGAVKRLDDERVAIIDNYFNKTRANIQAGSRGSLLMLSADRKPYQIKGRIEYVTEGAILDELREWQKQIKDDLPGVGAAIIHVESVFSGGEQLV